jgi:hypothetical protein
MWTLAATFPTLTKWVAQHVSEPFDGTQILAALQTSWVTTGSRFALLFLADVWNSSRYWLPESSQSWSLTAAFACWDDAHRNAALAWLKAPWWP